jgi:hypothetical protein
MMILGLLSSRDILFLLELVEEHLDRQDYLTASEEAGRMPEAEQQRLRALLSVAWSPDLRQSLLLLRSPFHMSLNLSGGMHEK